MCTTKLSHSRGSLHEGENTCQALEIASYKPNSQYQSGQLPHPGFALSCRLSATRDIDSLLRLICNFDYHQTHMRTYDNDGGRNLSESLNLGTGLND